MCPDWKSVPIERGYLAMSSATLEDVLECCISETWRLQNPFELCKPRGQICNRRHFLVNSQNRRAYKGLLDIQKHGAVIIGHEQSTGSRWMDSVGDQQDDNGQEATTTPRTGVDSQSLLGLQSEEMSRPTASSSAIRSSDNMSRTISNTTTETSQNRLKIFGRTIEHSLNTSDAELATPSGASISVEPIKKPPSMDLPHSDANKSTPDSNMEASQIPTSFSQDDVGGMVVALNTVPVADPRHVFSHHFKTPTPL
ncbi:hypothetical protein G7054_g4436 [Neopestalotiopsis clavispora]|nr:hypothetical protein G7054_g4436 [Neopestalotiopsis clavispora]